MTTDPDIIKQAREVVAKFPTPPDNRNECVKIIAAALLSERTASEAALKEAWEVIAKFADMIDGWVRPDPAVVGEAFVQLYDRCDEARAFLAKTGGA